MQLDTNTPWLPNSPRKLAFELRKDVLLIKDSGTVLGSTQPPSERDETVSSDFISLATGM